MRRSTAAASALLLSGCMIGGTVAPAPDGPVFFLDLTNATAEERTASYEFEMPGSSGGGETMIGGCRREAYTFGTIQGAYRMLVDGKAVSEGTVPAGVGADAFYVIRIRIGPDGEVEVAEPAVLPEAPPAVSAALPGCET